MRLTIGGHSHKSVAQGGIALYGGGHLTTCAGGLQADGIEAIVLGDNLIGRSIGILTNGLHRGIKGAGIATGLIPSMPQVERHNMLAGLYHLVIKLLLCEAIEALVGDDGVFATLAIAVEVGNTGVASLACPIL